MILTNPLPGSTGMSDPYVAYRAPGKSISVDGLFTILGSLAFFLYPLLWSAGAQQFVWYVVCLPLGVCILARGVRLPRHSIVVFGGAGLFLVAVSLSAFSLSSAPSFRVITYFRDALTYCTIFSIILWSTSSPRRWWMLDRLLRASIWMVGTAAIAGTAAWAFHVSSSFHAWLYDVVPASVTNTGLGHAIFVKSLIYTNETWLDGNALTRARSVFLYSNTYSVALELAIPFAMYYAVLSRGLRKFWYSGLIAVMVVGIYTTTSRAGALSFTVGLTVLALVAIPKILARRATLVVVAIEVTVLVAAAGLCVALLWQEVKHLATVVVYARGRGSAVTRGAIYAESLRWALRNPLGYGVNRDVPGIAFPLGSHSQYIGVLFKYGILGLASWLAIIGNVLGKAFRQLRKYAARGMTKNWWFYACAAMALSSIVAHQAVAELTLDVPVAVVFALVCGAVLARDAGETIGLATASKYGSSRVASPVVP